ncbi:hypothetical protein HXX76_001723 [Chlamydomonas incerta]|uniref:Uncharacterized protein n=1 Tax=Chlamydomonas incerta TaxID=51695 RepID=A0A835TDA9_CHLIN|nr:hypothetical protein HXX76_001723 [Chlamydomonas incerta]|eukprot:KAG2443362.1 hypothetical protein HXX76_001723 [Chlamydomonas incerta]
MAKASQAFKDALPSSLQKQVTTGEWKRTLLWMMWTINLLINAVYMVMTFATCNKLVNSFYKLNISLHNNTWRAPIAATVLGGLMVLTFNIMSCVILIRKSVNRSGPGFGYGFIMAWCFVMSFFCLLCGLVTSGFYPIVQDVLQPNTSWSSIDTGAYAGTTVFSFICGGFYMFFFISLVVFQGGIMKQTGLYDPRQDEKRKMEMAVMQHSHGLGNPLAGQAPVAHTI